MGAMWMSDADVRRFIDEQLNSAVDSRGDPGGHALGRCAQSTSPAVNLCMAAAPISDRSEVARWADGTSWL